MVSVFYFVVTEYMNPTYNDINKALSHKIIRTIFYEKAGYNPCMHYNGSLFDQLFREGMRKYN